MNKIPYYTKNLRKELNDINISFITEDLTFESFTRAKVESLERRLHNLVHDLEYRENACNNDIAKLKMKWQLIIEQAQ